MGSASTAIRSHSLTCRIWCLVMRQIYSMHNTKCEVGLLSYKTAISQTSIFTNWDFSFLFHWKAQNRSLLLLFMMCLLSGNKICLTNVNKILIFNWGTWIFLFVYTIETGQSIVYGIINRIVQCISRFSLSVCSTAWMVYLRNRNIHLYRPTCKSVESVKSLWPESNVQF